MLSRLIFLTVILIPVPSFARTVCGLMSVGLDCGDMYNSVDVFNGKGGVSNMTIDIDPQTCQQLHSTGMKVYCVNVERVQKCFPGGQLCGNYWVPTSQFAIDEARSEQELGRLEAEKKARCRKYPQPGGFCS